MKYKARFLSLLLAATLFCFAAAAAGANFDINGDGMTSIADALAVLRTAVGESDYPAADTDGDGRVTLLDALRVLRHILDKPAALSYSYTDIVGRLTDTRYLSLGGSGEKSLLASSYDRASKFEDGRYLSWRANGDGSQSLGATADGGLLLADIHGAGYISRIWTATAGPGHVKIFIDGETEPTFDLPFTDYFSGKAAPFTYGNLSYADTARGQNCYLPITFSTSCRVVGYGGYGDNGWGKYYHINYTLFADGVTLERMPKALSPEQSAALKAANTRLGQSGQHPDGLADAPFETATVSKGAPLVKTLTGKGAISGLLVRLPDHDGDYAISESAVDALKDLRIQIFWDGRQSPTVSAPLGDFFASAFGFDEVRTLLVGKRADRTFYNYFYMPYLSGARIVIYTVGDGSERVSLSVNVVENTCGEDEMLYFGAQFTRGHYHADALDGAGNYNKDGQRSPDYHFLTVEGGGRFVGLTLHVNKTVDGADPLSSPGSPWWGEGDEKFFVDGEKFPSWFGTGTEDFFGYAWCSPLWFSKPYHAQSYCEGSSNSVGSRVVSRLLVGDSIPFACGFEGYLEKYYTDDYAKYGLTSYFYLAKGSTLSGIDYDADAPLDYYKPKTVGKGFLIEGEDLYVERYLPSGNETRTAAASHIDRQPMANYGPYFSGNAQMLVMGLGEGGSIELALPAPSAGRYMLLISFANAPDFTILRARVNGDAVGVPVDTYAAAVSASTLTEFGEVTLDAGRNILRLTNVGKNAANTTSLYRFGLDFILLVPAEDYTDVSALDLSQYTDVYRANTRHAIADEYSFEGETDLFESAKASAGTPAAQSMTSFGSDWSGNKQLFLYNKTASDFTLTLYVCVPQAGRYDMTGAFTAAGDYGKFRLSVNGRIAGNFDFYHSGVVRTVVEIGALELAAGYNKLVFTCTGKNASSTGYCIGVDLLRFTQAD